MKLIFRLYLFCFLTVSLSGQEDTLKNTGKMRLLGFNMTEMVTQFMPFSNRLSETGPFAFKYMGGRNGNLFNFQIGADVIDEPSFNEFEGFNFQQTYVNMEFGYARLRNVSDKFYHYFSQNMMISSGFLNQPDEEFLFFSDSFVAFNAGWGVGYMLSPRVSISTEIQFIFSMEEFAGDGRFQFIPPIGLFLVTHL